MNSPFTPIQAIQDEQREGWVSESKPLEAELAEKDAQIAQLQSERDDAHALILALLAELQNIKTYMRSDPITRPCDGNAQVINRIERLLSTPPPPVVSLEDVKPLVKQLTHMAKIAGLMPQPKPGDWDWPELFKDACKTIDIFHKKHPTTK